ncbi:MAG: response regulator transcription factor [bacterium]|nr:response regulator transcription factor [bacterium]
MVGPFKVFIVDDHPLLREGIKTKLRSDSRFDFCGEAGNARDALSLIAQCKAQLAIVDISLPDRSGIELTKELRLLYPDLKILILSVHIEPSRIVEAFQSGANGYLSKEVAPENLLTGLATIATGKYYIDPTISPQVVSALLNVPPKKIVTDDRFRKLTDREREVMQYVVDGKTSKQIAELLQISEKTVEKTRSSIYEKLNVNGARELEIYARRIGLIE